MREGLEPDVRLAPLGLDVVSLEDYARFVNDPVTNQTTSPYQPDVSYRLDQLEQWLRRLKDASDRHDFAILVGRNRQFAGEVVINEIDGSTANIRIALMPDFWGQGIGFLAMTDAIHFGFNSIKLSQLTLSVFRINQRARRLYEKLGFQKVGEESYKGFDQELMRLAKEDWIS